MIDQAVNAAQIEQDIEARYRGRTIGSRERHLEARRYLPGGETRSSTWHAPYPTYMVAGDGAWLKDCDGNRYLDFLNNYTSLIHGHAPAAVVEETADQMTRGSAFGSAAEPQVELAKLLIERVPSIDMLRFTNSGTEATMMMMRAARAYTGRDVIVKMDGGYHGSHDFVEVNINPDMSADQPAAHVEGRGVPGDVLNTVMIAPFNDLAALESLLSAHHRRVAGIIIEPMPNSGGMIPPAPGYLRGLRELADRYETLLLFDEIVTFRLSRGGMQEVEGALPDMTALAKIIGGGTPVGAFGGRAEIMRQFDPGAGSDSLNHSGTFNGNNLTMTAGLATMKRLDEGAISRINDLGESLATGVNGLFESLGIRAQCLGFGSLQQIHWTDAPLETLKDAARAGQGIGRLRELLHLELLNRGRLQQQSRHVLRLDADGGSRDRVRAGGSGGGAADAEALYAGGGAAAAVDSRAAKPPPRQNNSRRLRASHRRRSVSTRPRPYRSSSNENTVGALDPQCRRSVSTRPTRGAVTPVDNIREQNRGIAHHIQL